MKLIAPAVLGGVVNGRSGQNYVIGADGTISNVNALDVTALMNVGFQWAVTARKSYTTPGAPLAASAAVTVTSTALANGTLAVAAQPDQPRQLQVLINSGSLTLSAGALASLTYTANDGTTQTDVLAPAGLAATSIATLTTTKGVLHLTGAVVSGVPAAAAANAGIQVGTNATLAVPVDPGFVDFQVLKETKITPTAGTLGLTVPADETIGTVNSTGAMIAPTQAPDGTHALSFEYTYVFPG
jgi:hypothetical protein